MFLVAYLVTGPAAGIGLLKAAQWVSWRLLAGTILGTALAAGLLLWSFAAAQIQFAPSDFRNSAITFCVFAFVPGVVAGTIVLPAGPPDWPAGSRPTRLIVAWVVMTTLWAGMAPWALLFTACGLEATCTL